MKVRLVAALAMVAAATTMGTADAAPTHATLIDIDVIYAARNNARPVGTANCSNAGSDSGRYVLGGWAVGGNTTAYFNTTTIPATLGTSATVNAVQQSSSAWTGAPSINITTSTSSSLKPTANRTYEVMFGRAGGTTLAVTYTWRWSDGYVESDVLFNDTVAWANLGSEGDGCYETAGPVYDVANIGTHEFGHVFGLGHPSSARFETMYAYGYSGETLKRSLASGDRAGIAANY